VKMNSDNQYQEFMRAKIVGAIAEANAASTLTHRGVKGTILEILVGRLFRPLLPSDLGIGTGQIIDCEGRMSNQIDIILYDRSILPPALYDDNTGIFPIEAALYAIEVKTKLTRADLVQAHESAKTLAGFSYLKGETRLASGDSNLKIERVRCVLFALTSSTGGSEAHRYHGVYGTAKDSPHVRALCVAGKEYCYDDSHQWVTQKYNKQYDEILSFLGGVMNTYREVAESRRRPLLGNYLIPSVSVETGPITGPSNRVQLKCEKCAGEFSFVPHFPNFKTLTINGHITSKDPCPSCGGALRTEPGVYEVLNGKIATFKPKVISSSSADPAIPVPGHDARRVGS